MHPVSPQECTYRRRYVDHNKVHTTGSVGQKTQLGPTDPRPSASGNELQRILSDPTATVRGLRNVLGV